MYNHHSTDIEVGLHFLQATARAIVTVDNTIYQIEHVCTQTKLPRIDIDD